jgi:hypothetical protein
MKTVLDYIEEKRQTFMKAPLFAFLSDRSIPPRDRLAFTPCLAHFVMTFADLNALVLREPLSKDPIQSIINAHTHEDDSHWKMFLADLDTLGMNESSTLSDVVQLLWSEDTKNIRRTCYSIISMLAETEPELRIVIVEAFEATGAVSISYAVAVGLEFEQATGKKLLYWGGGHASAETGHAMGTPDVENHLRSIVFSEPQRIRAFALVDRVFQSFWYMMDDVLACAQKRRARREQAGSGPKGEPEIADARTL